MKRLYKTLRVAFRFKFTTSTKNKTKNKQTDSILVAVLEQSDVQNARWCSFSLSLVNHWSFSVKILESVCRTFASTTFYNLHHKPNLTNCLKCKWYFFLTADWTVSSWNDSALYSAPENSAIMRCISLHESCHWPYVHTASVQTGFIYETLRQVMLCFFMRCKKTEESITETL